MTFGYPDFKGSLFWARFLNSTAIFIPAFFYGFVYEFFSTDNKGTFKVRLSYIFSVWLFISTWLFPSYFIPTVSRKMEFAYYPVPGPLYYLFVFQFFLVVTIGFLKIIQRIVNGEGSRQKNWIIFGAMAIGFGGGATTFPLVFNIPIFPFGAICPSLLAVTMAYAITKHELMDIKVIVTRSLANLIAAVLFFFPFAIIWIYQHRLPFGPVPYCIAWAAAALFGIIRFRNWLQTSAYKKFLKFDYDFDETLKAISSNLILAQNTEDVIETMMLMQDSLEIGQCYAFLRKDDSDQFECFRIEKTKSDQEIPDKTLIGSYGLDNPFLSGLEAHFRKVQRVISLETANQQFLTALGVSQDSICISIDSFKAFQAVFIIGQRLNEETYDSKDLALFEVIANQAIIVFERITQTKRLLNHQARLEALNIELESKVKEAVALAQQHFHQAAFSTLASGMAHEIRNPMAAMVAGAGFLAQSLEGKKKNPLEEFGAWDRKLAPEDFLEVSGHDLEKATAIYLALITGGHIDASWSVADLKRKDFSNVDLGSAFENDSFAIRAALRNFVTLAKLFDFVNVVTVQVPRILGITDTMMKYGVSGGGVKMDSFTKIPAVSDDDSELIFNTLLKLSYLDQRGGVLPGFNLLESGCVDQLAAQLPGHLRHLSDGIIRVVQSTPGAVKQPVNIGAVVSDTLSLVEGNCKKKKILLTRDIESGLPSVAGDEHRLQQAFFNIIYNAIQAMDTEVADQPRRLTVRAKAVRFPIVGGALIDGIEIQFEDTGPGISSETKAKIFNPFFTTKDPTGGKNIGLGLSILNEVVSGHNGYIDVESELGNGTVFKVYLPKWSPS